MKKYGLLGKTLGHSYSKRYFDEKFALEGLTDCAYGIYERPSLEGIREWIGKEGLCGLNVTIPYKEEIIPYLDRISPEAEAIGAVNVVRIEADGTLSGFNTDAPAFAETLKPLLKPWHREALVLGTGGASKAVTFALQTLGIKPYLVSRKGEPWLSYSEAYEKAASTFLIVNTTPLGMFPNVDQTPWLNTRNLSPRHLCYDLVYNPEKTQFLLEAELAGSTVQNGLPMLFRQADLAWDIWQEGRNLHRK